MSIAGDESIVVDALSRVDAVTLYFVIDSATMQSAHERDEQFKDLLAKSSSLRLQRVRIDEAPIYYDVSSGWVRPYLPSRLRLRAFTTLRSLSHTSGRATSRLLQEKFIWPRIQKDAFRWTRRIYSLPACQRAPIHTSSEGILLYRTGGFPMSTWTSW